MSIATPGKNPSLKEIESTFDSLSRENFDLKLRLATLEDSLGLPRSHPDEAVDSPATALVNENSFLQHALADSNAQVAEKLTLLSAARNQIERLEQSLDEERLQTPAKLSSTPSFISLKNELERTESRTQAIRRQLLEETEKNRQLTQRLKQMEATAKGEESVKAALRSKLQDAVMEAEKARQAEREQQKELVETTRALEQALAELAVEKSKSAKQADVINVSKSVDATLASMQERIKRLGENNRILILELEDKRATFVEANETLKAHIQLKQKVTQENALLRQQLMEWRNHQTLGRVNGKRKEFQ